MSQPPEGSWLPQNQHPGWSPHAPTPPVAAHVPAGPEAPSGPSQPPAAPPRRRRGLIVTIVLLLVLLLAIGGAATYLYLTTTRWQESSADWEAEARGLGEDVARLEAELEGANAELAAVRDQLETAQARILDLANEKAQLGDENVATQRLLDYQAKVTEAAGNVTSALTSCTSAQSQLIGYLEDRDSYDPDDLERFAGQVDGLCQQARDANDQLQTALAE